MSARRPRGGRNVHTTTRAKRTRVQNSSTYHTLRSWRNDGVEKAVEKGRTCEEFVNSEKAGTSSRPMRRDKPAANVRIGELRC